MLLCILADGIDGKQARRINLSGPLGELFDHGLGELSGDESSARGIAYIVTYSELVKPDIETNYICNFAFSRFAHAQNDFFLAHSLSLVDSYSASLIPVCLYSVFGRGERFSVEPARFFYVLLTVLLNFYISHWEKYNTGVLYLPWA